MAKAELTASELIDLLGGNKAVADRFGVKSSAVSNWRASNRFPPRLHYQLLRWCKERNIRLPKGFFERMEQVSVA